MATLVAGSKTSAALFPRARAIVETSGGVIWIAYDALSAPRIDLAYSTNGGSSWTEIQGPSAGSSRVGTWVQEVDFSLFLDIDGYLHIVYQDMNNGVNYHVRGTPNGATAWTWSSAQSLFQGFSAYDPQIVVHREGTGWVAHVLCRKDSYARYEQISIASDGTRTRQMTYTQVSVSANVQGNMFLDFEHTGDGLTVKDNTPHVWIGWDAGNTSGPTHRKLTYSAGAWTLGSEVKPNTNLHASATHAWLSGFWDGSRLIYGGLMYRPSNATYDIAFWETTGSTTERILVSGAGTSHLARGSITYDSLGNAYLFGYGNGSGSAMGYRKWTRSTTTLETFVSLDATGTAQNLGYLTTKSGYRGYRLAVAGPVGSANPYSIMFDSVALDRPPTATITAPTADDEIDPRVPLTMTWTYSDWEGSPQLQYQPSWRVAGGSWNDLGAVAGAATSYQFAADTFPDDTDIEVRVRTHDGTTWGEWATAVPLNSTSWTYTLELPDSTEEATLNTDGWTSGEWEIQVRTADDVGFGPWSSSIILDVLTTNVSVFWNGSWLPAEKFVYIGSQWVQSNPELVV